MLLLVSAVHQVFAQFNFGKPCNPTLLNYFQDSVRFHRVVTKEAQMYACLYEFDGFGTCCDTESLREYMIKIVEADALRWNNAIKNSYFFTQEIFQNRDAIIAKVKTLLPYVQTEVAAKRMNENVAEAINYITTIFPLLTNDTLRSLEQKYKDNSQFCFDTISNYRKSSVCLVCSGRAQVFYDSKKLSLKQSSCDALLSECLPTFQYMVNAMAGFNSLFHILNSVSRQEIYPKLNDTTLFSSKLRSRRQGNLHPGEQNRTRQNDSIGAG
jgi:hypothetical protein